MSNKLTSCSRLQYNSWYACDRVHILLRDLYRHASLLAQNLYEENLVHHSRLGRSHSVNGRGIWCRYADWIPCGLINCIASKNGTRLSWLAFKDDDAVNTTRNARKFVHLLHVVWWRIMREILLWTICFFVINSSKQKIGYIMRNKANVRTYRFIYLLYYKQRSRLVFRTPIVAAIFREVFFKGCFT